jgi:hypothetical protein
MGLYDGPRVESPAQKPGNGSVSARLDQIPENRLLAEMLARFQTMQPFDEHEPAAVLSYEDGNLLPDLQDAFRDLLHFFRIERPTPLGGHIDVRDWKNLTLHHKEKNPSAVARISLSDPSFRGEAGKAERPESSNP